ncbi:IS4 family transposase [Streptomyces sp. me109]|nr:IS4 family transposase [Streptomyces sp. me109]
MSSQLSTCTLTRTTTVAAGAFAPGHLGGLTQHIPFELVDHVLEETKTVQARVRTLPSRVGIYFVLALGLFPSLGYRRVWDKLVAGLSGIDHGLPSEAALRQLRRRLGPEPIEALFETLAVPLARPTTTGACYRHWRTVAFDGCSSLKAPDLPRIRALLGKVRHHWGMSGYPALRLTVLCETGTRGLLGAVFGPSENGETVQAAELLPRLTPEMLLLADRAFDGDEFLRAVSETGSQFLIRLCAHRRPAVLAVLPDGSYLTRLRGLRVRIIEADITLTTSKGQRITGHYRLATTLLDHRHDPAEALIRLYHERWEIESAFYSLRHTLGVQPQPGVAGGLGPGREGRCLAAVKVRQKCQARNGSPSSTSSSPRATGRKSCGMARWAIFACGGRRRTGAERGAGIPVPAITGRSEKPDVPASAAAEAGRSELWTPGDWVTGDGATAAAFAPGVAATHREQHSMPCHQRPSRVGDHG